MATDRLPVYRAIVPPGRYAPAGWDDRQVERFFCTLRRRCVQFVRQTLSFPRKTENHVGARRYFVHEYNLCHAQGHYPFV